MKKLSLLILICCAAPVFMSQSCEKPAGGRNYITENVVIVVMDGPRYTETWGDPAHKYIPHLSDDLAPKGVVNVNFKNVGPTLTTSGHTAITTGHYQTINNGGGQAPALPSIFQFYQANKGVTADKTWVVTSKDKLEQLGRTAHTGWADRNLPKTNCGVDGLGTGYRNDSITFEAAMHVLETDHPNVMLVNFKEPDGAGHANDWTAYLAGIRNTDFYAWKIWSFLQEDAHYQGKTTFFFTNDHGRHLNGHMDGFISHGDQCEGCQHINFYASGPDFKQGIEVDNSRTLIDINATASRLLNIPTFGKYGKVMDELFR
jgi:hypothetical protein